MLWNAKKSYNQAREINFVKVDEYCNNLIKNGDNLKNQKLFDSATDYYQNMLNLLNNEEFFELNANDYRSDANKVFKIIDDYHWFDEVTEVDKIKKWLQTIYIWILNIWTGNNIYFGSKKVNIK